MIDQGSGSVCELVCFTTDRCPLLPTVGGEIKTMNQYINTVDFFPMESTWILFRFSKFLLSVSLVKAGFATRCPFSSPGAAADWRLSQAYTEDGVSVHSRLAPLSLPVGILSKLIIFLQSYHPYILQYLYHSKVHNQFVQLFMPQFKSLLRLLANYYSIHVSYCPTHWSKARYLDLPDWHLVWTFCPQKSPQNHQCTGSSKQCFELNANVSMPTY